MPQQLSAARTAAEAVNSPTAAVILRTLDFMFDPLRDWEIDFSLIVG